MKYLIRFAVVILIAGILSAQTSVEVDLSKNEGEKITISKNPFKLESIILKNRLVGKDIKYEFSVESIKKETPPLPAPVDRTIAAVEDSIPCTEFDALLDELLKLQEEKQIPDVVKKLKDQIEKVQNDKSLIKKCAKIIKIVDEKIEQTTAIITLPEPVELEIGKELKLIIKRGSKLWTIVYATETEENWSMLYGFTYVPNMMNPVESYFVKKDTGSTYLITPSNGQRKDMFKNLTPTIMYTWHPTKKYSFLTKQNWFPSLFSNNFYQTGFTAGVSLNLSVPTAMVGPSILISDNVSLNAGVVITQKDVLRGKYVKGERVTENLDFDQLHEKQWMGEWFISIGFRFDKNPFSSDDKKEKEKDTEKKEETKKE